MSEVDVYNINGEKVGKMPLVSEIFAAKIKLPLLHEVVTMQLANRRLGTASCKSRGEVSGSGRKPWRQKGTGRARAGSIRSPLWRHGGVIFGPHPRSYKYTMPKEKRHLALLGALTAKANDSKIIVLDNLKINEAKTKILANIFKKLSIAQKPLLILKEMDKKLVQAGRNIKGVKISTADKLNVYDVLTSHCLVFTKEALTLLEERFLKNIGHRLKV